MNPADTLLSFFLLHPVFSFLFIVWSLTLKGMALWKSSRREELRWFLALLILNTAGILEIVYLVLTNKKEKEALKEIEKKE